MRELDGDAGDISWRYAAFELDPTVPAGGVDAAEYLRGKYDAATVKGIYERLAAVGAAEGLPFAGLGEGRVRANTFAAHRLLTAALADGAAVQQELAEELFRACWADALDVGDHDVLVAAAVRAGLDEDRARAVLAGDAFAAEVRAEERTARELGITAVPTFVVDGRFAVAGAQPSAVLARTVRRALET